MKKSAQANVFIDHPDFNPFTREDALYECEYLMPDFHCHIRIEERVRDYDTAEGIEWR